MEGFRTDYSDMMDTQWPVATIRPKMPLAQRAKIFLPFSALTGYEQALENTLRNAVSAAEVKAGKIQFDDDEFLQ
ncbi:MAG: hypothetical protein KBT11_08010 [Treponema sp.]|nr:hypothetical protein [Candidatus Treponema equifaecale]